jgi:hypothetical protein
MRSVQRALGVGHPPERIGLHRMRASSALGSRRTGAVRQIVGLHALNRKRPALPTAEGWGTQRRGLNASEAGEVGSFRYVAVKATTETKG